MSEPAIVEWLEDREWHSIYGGSPNVWCILQEEWLHSDAMHEFPGVYHRNASLFTDVVFPRRPLCSFDGHATP